MRIAETSRLFLREMTGDDAASAYELNADPEVIQYTGDTAFESVEKAKQFLENYAHYKNYGFGRWAVILKETNEYLGWCGLKYLEEANKYDIGYRLMKKYWNKGYATEAALACLELGFNTFDLNEILAHADIHNKASIRVMEKIGMTFHMYDVEDGKDIIIYKILKNSFQK